MKLSVIFGKTLTIIGCLKYDIWKTLGNLNVCVPNVGNFNILRQKFFFAALDSAVPLQFKTEPLYGQSNIEQKQVITHVR